MSRLRPGTTPKLTSKVGSAAAGLLLLGCGGTLIPAGLPEPARLQLSFPPGQVAEYRTELHTEQVFGPGPTPSGLTAETVTDVTHRTVTLGSEGEAVLEIDADPVATRTNGQETQLATNPEPWRITVAPEGAILDSTRPIAFDTGQEPGDAPVIQANPIGAISPFPHLTPEAVRPGAEWTGGGRVPSPFGGGTVPFRVRGSLTGYELVGAVRSAVVKSRVVVELDVTVPAEEYLEQTSQTSFDVPPDAELDYDGQLRYVQRAWLQVERGQMLGSEIAGVFNTDVAWVGVPRGRQGFDPVQMVGWLQASTHRTG
jgi:hypothetical protein